MDYFLMEQNPIHDKYFDWKFAATKNLIIYFNGNEFAVKHSLISRFWSNLKEFTFISLKSFNKHYNFILASQHGCGLLSSFTLLNCIIAPVSLVNKKEKSHFSHVETKALKRWEMQKSMNCLCSKISRIL